MPDFGDWAESGDDAFDPSSIPDAEQVARRLHELRQWLDQETGSSYTAGYDDLGPAEKALADAIAQAVIDWLIDHPADATETARRVHIVRRYLSGNRLPEWDDLPPGDRTIGIALMQALIDWLQREGSI